MNEIINAIPEYVITLVVSTAIVYAFKYLENLIHAKALHAKTAQSKELWSFIEQVADTAVSSLVNTQMSGNDKFNQAITIVQDVLAKRGFTNVDVKSIESAVQAAYEKSDLTGNDTTDPVKVAIQTAPNRANDLTKEAD
ncbi:phage holin, LLH family [Limosilactobacillus urinaemulieris]|uniref:phage holin, LLH family n=1 Tax=Limosilactobacillus urinaemulieris TaxID=2742600 RepID=UPI0028EB83B6|nr:phage holin, LLH family [Limosilactobacillus urinaemulieris]